MTSWNSDNPANGSSASSDMRANFQAIEASLFGRNLLADPELRIWAGGDSAIPTCYFTAGTAPTITRCGIGLADTNRKFGPYCIKAVGGGATGYIGQYVIPPTDGIYGWDSYFGDEDAEFCAGVWAKTADLNAVRVGIGETTSSLDPGSYHTGSDTWEWITGPKHVAGSATVIAWMVEIPSGKTVYLSGPTATFGGITPTGPLPCPAQYGTLYFRTTGDFSTGTIKEVYHPARPGLVKDVMIYTQTAPTGANLIVDVNTWDGAALTSMFSTRPTITAGTNQGSARPDTTYARRCLAANFGTAAPGNILSIDVDQVGSSVAGANGYIAIRAMQYVRAFESLVPYNY